MMRIIAVLSIGVVVAAGAAVAQAPESQPVGTMREFMTSVVYPPTNELLLSMNRGAPASDTEWAAVQRSAIQLAESGNVMMMRGRAMDRGMWLKEARPSSMWARPPTRLRGRRTQPGCARSRRR